MASGVARDELLMHKRLHLRRGSALRSAAQRIHCRLALARRDGQAGHERCHVSLSRARARATMTKEQAAYSPSQRISASGSSVAGTQVLTPHRSGPASRRPVCSERRNGAEWRGLRCARQDRRQKTGAGRMTAAASLAPTRAVPRAAPTATRKGPALPAAATPAGAAGVAASASLPRRPRTPRRRRAARARTRLHAPCGRWPRCTTTKCPPRCGRSRRARWRSSAQKRTNHASRRVLRNHVCGRVPRAARPARAALNAHAPCTGHRRQVVCVRRDANHGAADWTRARRRLWCVRRTRRRRLSRLASASKIRLLGSVLSARACLWRVALRVCAP